MKFKSDIEVQAGLKDSSGSAGASGQLLSSTTSGTSWINAPAVPGSGGSSQVFYFNGGTASSVVGYQQMSIVANTGTAVDFSINANGYVASFLTDVASPNQLNIPAGNWNFEIYMSASSGGGSPSFYVELYKYSSSTFTLIASSSAAPEGITNGTAIDLYTTALAVPTTALLVTDRLAVRVYVTHSGRTITMHTQNGHLSEVITTFSTGLTALNGLTAQVQYFAVGTAGTDFGISSATNTHTFNLPTASASNRGALSSSDWSAFNGKFTLPSLTSGSVLFSNGTTIAQDNANFFWDDTNNRLGIATASPDQKLTVIGNVRAGGVGNGFLLDTTGVNFTNGMKTVNDYETVMFSGRGSAGYVIAGDNNIRFGFGTTYTAGEAMRISSTTGYVGIGTSSAANTLDVLGTFRSQSTSSTGGLAELTTNGAGALATCAGTGNVSYVGAGGYAPYAADTQAAMFSENSSYAIYTKFGIQSYDTNTADESFLVSKGIILGTMPSDPSTSVRWIKIKDENSGQFYFINLYQ